MAPPPFKRTRKAQESQSPPSSSLETTEYRRAQNATASIFKLHPEILSDVLAIIACHSDYDFPPFGPPYRWIRYTHVCHYWREVALSSPRVWSHVRLTNNLDCMREMLSRSKQAPLHFGFGFQVLLSIHLDLLCDNVHRARSISLFLTPNADSGFSERPLELPWLTELSLLSPEYDIPGHLPRKDIIFGPWDMPKLSHLAIRGFYAPWSHTIFRQGSLTHLTVSRSAHGSRRERVVFEDLVEVLRGAPFLEELVLEYVLGSDMKESRTTDIVPLNNLRSLRLVDHLASCARVLSRVSFPLSVPISVVGLEADRPSADAFGRAIASQVATQDDVEKEDRVGIRSLSIVQKFNETCIRGFSQELAVGLLIDTLNTNNVLNRPTPCIEVILRDNHSTILGYALCTPLPLHAVQTLLIETRTTELPVPVFQAMAREMTAVHTFGVRSNPYECAANIPPLLSLDVPELSSNQQLIFPRLANLELSHVELRPDENSPDDDNTLSTLLTMFSQRADMGAKVQEVHLYDPMNMFKRDAERLEEVVGKVVWNPREVHYSTIASSDDEQSVDSEMAEEMAEGMAEEMDDYYFWDLYSQDSWIE